MLHSNVQKFDVMTPLRVAPQVRQELHGIIEGLGGEIVYFAFDVTSKAYTAHTLLGFFDVDDDPTVQDSLKTKSSGVLLFPSEDIISEGLAPSVKDYLTVGGQEYSITNVAYRARNNADVESINASVICAISVNEKNSFTRVSKL